MAPYLTRQPPATGESAHRDQASGDGKPKSACCRRFRVTLRREKL